MTLATLTLLGSVVAAGSQPTPQVIDLKAPDGAALKATYFSAGKPAPALLLFPQCNQDRRSWMSFAQKAAASGFHVLTVDYRGHGESGGRRFNDSRRQQQRQITLEKWPVDVDTAFDWLMS
ncbi:MAG: hypothetical protein M3R55_12920 [Acidobacteriota bacterium]|nr:hypothetical protein [Acidobacteriota bacterium]